MFNDVAYSPVKCVSGEKNPCGTIACVENCDFNFNIPQLRTKKTQTQMILVGKKKKKIA